MLRKFNKLKIKISNKLVGDGYPTFIIAEGGINHNGNVKIAKKIIREAKNAGADAIKFQTFEASDLFSSKSKYFNLFKKLELESDDFAELSDYSKSHKIIFLSTPFSNQAVDLLSKLHVPAFKIASGDLTNIPLIKHAASKKKPMIISTGMSTLNEIHDAIKAIRTSGNKNILLMHSVSAYPTSPYETNLNVIEKMTKIFHCHVGYSDNGDDMLVPLIAIAKGAKLIEKHFTLDKKMKGLDHSLSANPIEFKTLVERIRAVEKMSGTGLKSCQQSELQNRIYARRSIVAKVTIQKGTIIKQEMLAVKRPAIGIEPKYLHKLLRKKALRKICAEEAIKWKDVYTNERMFSTRQN